MKKDHYSGSLTRERFLFLEIRLVAGLILKGSERIEIANEIYESNLFQFPTERMIRSTVNTCFNRIDALESDELVFQLANASTDVAKQINLYAIMCENSVVRDFMTYVIGEKYRLQEFNFSPKNVNVFFMELAEKVPSVGKWSESTLKKIKQVLVKFLVECQYLDDTRSHRLNNVFIYPELESVIRAKGDADVLPAFNCWG